MTPARTTGLAVPVEAARRLVRPWLDHLPASRRDLPPHVTILWPFLAPEEVDTIVERDLEALFAGAAPFEFALERVAGFADAAYLAPAPPGPFADLTRLVWRQWPECPPFGGAYDDIVPHLTVALDPPPGVRASIERELAGRLPLTARAVRVALFEEDDHGLFAVRRHFSLGDG